MHIVWDNYVVYDDPIVMWMDQYKGHDSIEHNKQIVNLEKWYIDLNFQTGFI